MPSRSANIIAAMPAKSIEARGREVAAGLVPVAGSNCQKIKGDDAEDTRLLRQMAKDAREYISSFSWCAEIHDTYFGGGVGGIFAVFLFHIRPGGRGVDPWIWIVVGDIPSAYLPLSDADSPREVFETYIAGMRRWVKLARNGKRDVVIPPDIPPVNVPPTPEWAERLKMRLDGLEEAGLRGQ